MKFHAWLIAAFLSVVAVGADPVAKHTITHEDVWLMKRVSAPVPSPDGHWVVFTVTEPAYDAKEQWADLWIKSLTDGSAPRRLTYSKGPESGVDWSPDSQRLVFSAKREGDEVTQLYLLDLSGGEAVRLTNLTLGARQAKWSPDGKQLLFVSEVYPGAADEAANQKAAKEHKARKYNVHAADQFPARFWDHWLDDKKAHLFVMAAAPDAKPRDLLAGTKLAALPGFGAANTDEGASIDAVWTPDGSGVVFSMATNRDEAARANVNAQLYLVPATGGEPQRLTNDAASYGTITFAPDGKALFSLSEANTPGKIYNVARLVSFPWPFQADARKVLTADYDRSIGRFALTTGSDRVYFTCEHAGLEQLHSIAREGGAVRDEPSAATGCIGTLRAGGPALVGTWESAVSPPEVYAFGGTGPKALTQTNTARTAAIDWSPVEHFTFKAADGREIHSMLVKPAGFDPAKKYPLFVVIHGGADTLVGAQVVVVTRLAMKEEVSAAKAPQLLAGKTVVFTGELETFSRSQAERRVRELGGNATSSVSAKTDFVVVGKAPGSKAAKAQKLGVKILTEKEFASKYAAKQN